jgi:hypothetical protein
LANKEEDKYLLIKKPNSAVGVDKVTDFSVGYSQSGNKITLTATFNSVMGNINPGLAWSKGMLQIVCSGKDGTLRGLLF